MEELPTLEGVPQNIKLVIRPNLPQLQFAGIEFKTFTERSPEIFLGFDLDAEPEILFPEVFVVFELVTDPVE